MKIQKKTQNYKRDFISVFQKLTGSLPLFTLACVKRVYAERYAQCSEINTREEALQDERRDTPDEQDSIDLSASSRERGFFTKNKPYQQMASVRAGLFPCVLS